MSNDTPRPERVTLTNEEREMLARSVAAAINYHSFDAAAETADFDMADAILDTNLAATSAGLAVTVERILAAREQALREEVAGEIKAYARRHKETSDWGNLYSDGVVHGLNVAASITQGGAR